MKKDWIVFFSQTGTEIVDIAESLGRWPDKIITNKRPENLRKINDKLLGKEIVYLPNKPSLKDYQEILNKHDDLIITLHGWLRIMPAEICNEYAIFNGHPGLITAYPELKGKDPQIRALEGKYPVMGCVLHKVTAGVDEGKIIAEERFNAFEITEEEMWKATRDRSLYLWIQFLNTFLV